MEGEGGDLAQVRLVKGQSGARLAASSQARKMQQRMKGGRRGGGFKHANSASREAKKKSPLNSLNGSYIVRTPRATRRGVNADALRVK